MLHRLAGSPESNASLEDYPYAPKVSETNLSAVRWAWEKGLIAEDECVWYLTQAVSPRADRAAADALRPADRRVRRGVRGGGRGGGGKNKGRE